MTPTLPPACTYEPTMPSDTVLAALFAADARPFSLRYTTASSILSLVSARAFLQSIIPAPVFSLKSLTRLADISIKPPNKEKFKTQMSNLKSKLQTPNLCVLRFELNYLSIFKKLQQFPLKRPPQSPFPYPLPPEG